MGIGRREVVGLVFFGIAIMAAFTFLDPTAYSSTGAPERSQGLPPPTEAPEPTPTPVSRPFTMPEQWIVSFYSVGEGGEEEFFTRAFLDEVDLAYETGPVGQLGDNAWAVLAEAPVSLQEGRYSIRVIHDGEVEVFLNGMELASAHDPEGGEAELPVIFDHPGGSLVLGVRGQDVSGPFRLRVEPVE